MPSFDSFVGLPWESRGRLREGADCWGLACLVFADHLGIELPSHSTDYLNTADKNAIDALIAGGIGTWTKVDDAKPYDLVLMRERPWHVGIVVHSGTMLHMPHGKSSVIEQYTVARHAARVRGIYRHVLRMES